MSGTPAREGRLFPTTTMMRRDQAGGAVKTQQQSPRGGGGEVDHGTRRDARGWRGGPLEERDGYQHVAWFDSIGNDTLFLSVNRTVLFHFSLPRV